MKKILIIEDDEVIAKELQELLQNERVVLTGHQAFFTEEALRAIAEVTLGNLKAFVDGAELVNQVK